MGQNSQQVESIIYEKTQIRSPKKKTYMKNCIECYLDISGEWRDFFLGKQHLRRNNLRYRRLGEKGRLKTFFPYLVYLVAYSF